MPDLNANIPYLWGYVRDSYLYADPSLTSLTECYVFGAKAILNRPLGFHVQLDNGAVFMSLPLSAIVWKPDFEPLSANENERLSLLEWWDCQSSSLAVTVFQYLEGYTVDCRNRNGDWMRGRYLFTIDDYYADANSLPVGYAQDADAKCFHVIQLDNGNYAAYPNNYLRWHNLNHVTPYDVNNPPRYKANGWDMRCEHIGADTPKNDGSLIYPHQELEAGQSGEDGKNSVVTARDGKAREIIEAKKRSLNGYSAIMEMKSIRLPRPMFPWIEKKSASQADNKQTDDGSTIPESCSYGESCFDIDPGATQVQTHWADDNEETRKSQKMIELACEKQKSATQMTDEMFDILEYEIIYKDVLNNLVDSSLPHTQILKCIWLSVFATKYFSGLFDASLPEDEQSPEYTELARLVEKGDLPTQKELRVFSRYKTKVRPFLLYYWDAIKMLKTKRMVTVNEDTDSRLFMRFSDFGD